MRENVKMNYLVLVFFQLLMLFHYKEKNNNRTTQ